MKILNFFNRQLCLAGYGQSFVPGELILAENLQFWANWKNLVEFPQYWEFSARLKTILTISQPYQLRLKFIHSYIILRILSDEHAIGGQLEYFGKSRKYCWDRPKVFFEEKLNKGRLFFKVLFVHQGHLFSQFDNTFSLHRNWPHGKSLKKVPDFWKLKDCHHQKRTSRTEKRIRLSYQGPSPADLYSPCRHNML